MMADCIVNILCFGDEGSPGAFVKELRHVSVLPEWFGKKRPVSMRFEEENVMVVSFNNNELPQFTVQFVNSPYSQSEMQFQVWAEQFRHVVLLCDAKRFEQYRNEIARLRCKMTIAGRYNDALLFLQGFSSVIPVHNNLDYQHRQLKAYSCISSVKEYGGEDKFGVALSSFFDTQGYISMKLNGSMLGFFPTRLLLDLGGAECYIEFLLYLLNGYINDNKMCISNFHGVFNILNDEKN